MNTSDFVELERDLRRWDYLAAFACGFAFTWTAMVVVATVVKRKGRR